MSLYILLPIVFIFLVIIVGGYVYMFLHIMRSDPREINYRESQGDDSGLVPKKDSSSISSK